MNKNIIFMILGLVLILSVVGFKVVDEKEGFRFEDTSVNYPVALRLGLAPSAQSRMPTEKDKFTGIKFRNGDREYSLIESGSLEKGDWGKSFIVRTR